MDEEQKKKVDHAIEALILLYLLRLSKASLDVSISSAYYAIKELNIARTGAGLVTVDTNIKDISVNALRSAKNYKAMLEDKGGSMIVNSDHKKEFVPWINNLKDGLKIQITDIVNNLPKEQWDSEFQKIGDFAKNVRVPVTSWLETRVQMHDVKKQVWKREKLEKLERCSVDDDSTCAECISLDGEIYGINEAPDIEVHLHCRCYYIVYFG
ncbi:MAG TPA: hypothetical protein VFD03_03550 [Clostridia bacterium]|nr:hypothetical protein [Clostridia bacterium]